MARGGFRFAAGKPDGRRRAPTFYRWFRIELHTAKWTRSIFLWNEASPGSVSIGRQTPRAGPPAAGRRRNGKV